VTTTAAERLSEFATGWSTDDIPATVQQEVKFHLLDAIGCGLASCALGQGVAARGVTAAMGGQSEATAIGLNKLVPAANAALANGMLIHALDYDDTHAESITHPSTVVVPAAIAAGERADASGRDVLAAVAIGIEIVTRVGAAAAGAFHARGFHPTSVAGVFGAAAAASRLGGADAKTTTNALGIAGSLAAGLFAYLEDGTPTKPIHAGWAAHGGIVAADLSAAGGAGPRSVLEGRFGLYDAFTEGSASDALDRQLATIGEEWEAARLSFKPYPVCHYMHGVLGAAATLQVDVGAIDEITVAVPAAGVPLVLEPLAAKVAPRSEYEAKFSLPFALASFLRHGSLTVASFSDENLADPATRDLARRIRYRIEPFEGQGAAFPGAIAIRFRNGTGVDARLDYAQGSPENPVPAGQIVAKFHENARLALDAAHCLALEKAILTLEERRARKVFLILATAKAT
jgi:2-methylcitrate dehydratase PrpD